MLGYATIGTNDLPRALGFYDGLMSEVGAKRLMELPSGFTMYGIDFGTPALATRGLQVDDFKDVGQIIVRALQPDFESARGELAERVTAIADRYPLYTHLGTPAAV